MKNEMSNEKEKMTNVNVLNSIMEGRLFDFRFDPKKSTEILNTSIIHKFGHISNIKDRLCNWPPGWGRSPDTSRGHPNRLVFS